MMYNTRCLPENFEQSRLEKTFLRHFLYNLNVRPFLDLVLFLPRLAINFIHSSLPCGQERHVLTRTIRVPVLQDFSKFWEMVRMVSFSQVLESIKFVRAGHRHR